MLVVLELIFEDVEFCARDVVFEYDVVEFWAGGVVLVVKHVDVVF